MADRRPGTRDRSPRTARVLALIPHAARFLPVRLRSVLSDRLSAARLLT
jgi:hypothetical protein